MKLQNTTHLFFTQMQQDLFLQSKWKKRCTHSNRPALQGGWTKQTIHSGLCGNHVHCWRVILRLHTAMSREEWKDKGERRGSWFHGLQRGASITWEWIGVMTLFLSTSWVHLYIHFCGGRAIHLSKPPQLEHLDKGTNRQIDKTLSRVKLALLLTLWNELYISGFLIVFRGN